MEHLDFVLWMVLYPLAGSIASYFDVMEKKLNNEKPYSKETIAFAALINIIIWASVGMLLFKF